MQLPRIRLATPILAEEAIFKRKPVLSVEGYQHLYTLITKLPTPLCLCGEELSLCVLCGFSLCPLRLKAFFRNFGSRYAQRELPEILYQHCLILFAPGPVKCNIFSITGGSEPARRSVENAENTNAFALKVIHAEHGLMPKRRAHEQNPTFRHLPTRPRPRANQWNRCFYPAAYRHTPYLGLRPRAFRIIKDTCHRAIPGPLVRHSA